jgi:hypothetical protein
MIINHSTGGFVGNFQGVLSIKNDWTLEFGVEFGPRELFSSHQLIGF